MKFDNIIIGGGLSGLTSGIRLAESGKKCAIISTGQSALQFFSGSFDLLGKVDGKEVKNPVNSIMSLPSTHPYSRIGIENINSLVNEVPGFLNRAGIETKGDSNENHYVLTPLGTLKPTWLTLNDFTRFEERSTFPWQKAVIFNFCGFLDFHVLFAKEGLIKLGVYVEIKNIAMKEFEAIRRNPSEMRSTNIAKVFDKGDAMKEFVQKINELSEETDVVMLPAIFGLFNRDVLVDLRAKVDKPVALIPVVPPSVPGIRSQIQLRNRFQQLGGMFFLGDNVEEGMFDGNRLKNIETKNHGNIKLEAKQFILASGSFFSKGLVASPDKIYEPVFGLDIQSHSDRKQWIDENFYNNQPFMEYGIKTDQYFRAIRNGNSIENLYVAGSVLGAVNSLKEGSGGGISLLTSLFIANQIIKL